MRARRGSAQAAATTSHASGVQALPASICEPVIASGDADADLLIVSGPTGHVETFAALD